MFAFTFTNLSTKNLIFDRPQSLTNRALGLVQQTRTKLNRWVSRVFPVLEAFCFSLDTFGSSLALLLFLCVPVFLEAVVIILVLVVPETIYFSLTCSFFICDL